MAHDRIDQRPDRYVRPRVRGDGGGRHAWLYLTGRPAREIRLLDLPDRAPALRTEAIQHGIFKYGLLPTLFYGALAAIMWHSSRAEPAEAGAPDDPAARPGDGE